MLKDFISTEILGDENKTCSWLSVDEIF
jgi:hypothetical protein